MRKEVGYSGEVVKPKPATVAKRISLNAQAFEGGITREYKKEKLHVIKKLSKRFAASRGSAALVLAGMLVLGSGLTATAQSEDDGSDNGLEGDMARAADGPRLYDGAAVEADIPSRVYVRQRGYGQPSSTAGQLPSLFTAGIGCLAAHDTATLTAR